MAMRDRERGTVFWSFGYPENIDQTHQTHPCLEQNQIIKTCCKHAAQLDEVQMRRE